MACDTWLFTVARETFSSAAASAVLMPAASRFSTSRSRSVSRLSRWREAKSSRPPTLLIGGAIPATGTVYIFHSSGDTTVWPSATALTAVARQNTRMSLSRQPVAPAANAAATRSGVHPLPRTRTARPSAATWCTSSAVSSCGQVETIPTSAGPTSPSRNCAASCTQPTTSRPSIRCNMAISTCREIGSWSTTTTRVSRFGLSSKGGR